MVDIGLNCQPEPTGSQTMKASSIKTGMLKRVTRWGSLPSLGCAFNVKNQDPLYRDGHRIP